MTRAEAILALSCVFAAACPVAAQDGPGAKPAGASTASGAASRPAMVVGVVDFVKVLDAYPRAIEERKRLDEARNQRQALLENDERKAQVIKQQRDGFDKDSSEWLFKDLELRLSLQALEGKRQILNEELRQQRDAFYGLMLGDMERAVEIVAQERGVTLVLRAHNFLGNGSNADKARIFEARVVWFAADEVDLTPAVVKLLQVPLPETKGAEAAKGTEASSGKRPDGGQPDGDQQAGNR